MPETIVERLRATCETGCDPDLIYEAADEIEALRVENERLKSEAASMWRGGVTNTIAVVDKVRSEFRDARKLKRHVMLAHFDAELDLALDEWFKATRKARPSSYAESEDEFHALTQTKDTRHDA